MNRREILESLRYGERVTLECKKAESRIPNSIWETYSAFANTSGGLILLGVEENVRETDFEKRFSFKSIENPEQRIRDFWNTINSAKVSSNILTDSDVGICEINGCNIIWIKVPQADYQQRPIYVNNNPMNGSYKRNHEGDYHCTEEEVKAMLRDARDSGNDGGLLTHYTMEDIDLTSLRSYRIEFEHRNPDHVWNGDDDQTFLKNMGGLAIDRSTGETWLTTAGLLMFGKGLSIRERFDNIRMDYIDECNLLPGSRWSDRVTYDGVWENNLYNFMRQIMPKLVSGIKRPFRLEGMVRVDDTSIHKAIREAVVNMMIHSDYLMSGVLKIIKMDNGFAFYNPGNLKLPIKTIYEGGHSVARNPRIQTMFRMIGYGDNIGSGFPTILSAWGEENWRKPDLRQNEELHQVELKLWTISLMPQECTEHLNGLFGKDYMHLDNHSQIILGTAFLENEVTNSRMQSILNLHGTEIGRLLSELVDNGMLIANPNGRWTTYQLNPDYEQNPDQTQLPDSCSSIHFRCPSDKTIYEYIQANGFVTTAEIISITSITTKGGASAALSRLRAMGLVRKVQNGRQVFYELL